MHTQQLSYPTTTTNTTMRLALSLLALGCIVFLTSANNYLDLKTIKAVNSPSEDKDSFSFKGALFGDDLDELGLGLGY